MIVWHELGNGSLKNYRSHYNQYRSFEQELGITPRAINISEFGELRDHVRARPADPMDEHVREHQGAGADRVLELRRQPQRQYGPRNSANGGWWLYKWYGDLRGTQTVKVTSEHPDSVDNLQGVAAIDTKNRKATVLYGGANDATKIGANIPVTVHMTGLDQSVFGESVECPGALRTAYTRSGRVAATPRVVNVLSDQKLVNGTLDVTTTSIDRYAAISLW